MSEDPTRATPRQTGQDGPVHGRVGPDDPHADPATDPALRRVEARDDERPTVPVAARGDDAEPPTAPVRTDSQRGPVVVHSRTGGLWTGLIFSAVVLIFLLIFIVQNLEEVDIQFLGFTGALPIGVAMLLAAIGGLLLVAIPGGLRILQLRRAAKRAVRRP